MPSSDLFGHQVFTWCEQNTHTHKIKWINLINLKKPGIVLLTYIIPGMGTGDRKIAGPSG